MIYKAFFLIIIADLLRGGATRAVSLAASSCLIIRFDFQLWLLNRWEILGADLQEVTRRHHIALCLYLLDDHERLPHYLMRDGLLEGQHRNDEGSRCLPVIVLVFNAHDQVRVIEQLLRPLTEGLIGHSVLVEGPQDDLTPCDRRIFDQVPTKGDVYLARFVFIFCVRGVDVLIRMVRIALQVIASDVI